jgi:hypothetical protein
MMMPERALDLQTPLEKLQQATGEDAFCPMWRAKMLENINSDAVIGAHFDQSALWFCLVRLEIIRGW